MPTLLERINNREAFKVEIKGGTVWVREPSFGDVDRVAAIESGELKTALSLGLCLVEEDGKRAYEPNGGESDLSFATRMLAEMKSLGPSGLRAIQDAIQQLTKPVDVGELAKN